MPLFPATLCTAYSQAWHNNNDNKNYDGITCLPPATKTSMKKHEDAYSVDLFSGQALTQAQTQTQDTQDGDSLDKALIE